MARDERREAVCLPYRIGRRFQEGRQAEAFQGLARLRSTAHGSRTSRPSHPLAVELEDGSPAPSDIEGRARWPRFVGEQEVVELGPMEAAVRHLAAFRRDAGP